MDLDSQNNPPQTMDLHLTTRPRFSVGRELATLITSCGILQKAWEEICYVSINNVDFFVKEDEDVAYVTFPSFSTLEDFIVTDKDSKYGEYSIKNEKIFFLCLKGDADKPALVHKGVLDRFRRILKSLDFKAKMERLNAKTIIFVGHSMGGAVATLITLSFLQKKARQMSYFCVTFGSPLVGNDKLGEAIGRADWSGNFCHVVSRYDIVPRILFAPFDSIAEPLNVIMPHWRSRMGADPVVVTHPSMPEAHKTLLEKVLKGMSTIVDKSGKSDLASPYRPFGTYMFCSTQGAACIDDSEAVLKMLHFTMKGNDFDQLADTCASDHTGYGKMLEVITEKLLNATPIANFATDSFETGIVLELEAIAVGAQENPHASSALTKAGEKKNEQDTNIEKLNEELSKMQSYMAEVEWYKTRCKDNSICYYDAFKQHDRKKDIHVDMARRKLGNFWGEIVDMEEKNVLPSDFRTRNKWINTGTAYRRLIEPLDIAYHYGIQKNMKSYLSGEVRSHHHKVLQKWMEDKEQTRTRSVTGRTKFVSLTHDSCFWARLEEASRALSSLPQEKCKHPIQEFDQYIWDMIRDKSISVEVFLKESSFMNWWEQYKSYLKVQPRQLTSSSSFFSFMEEEGWKQEVQ